MVDSLAESGSRLTSHSGHAKFLFGHDSWRQTKLQVVARVQEGTDAQTRGAFNSSSHALRVESRFTCFAYDSLSGSA